jgi:hypothetical protein
MMRKSKLTSKEKAEKKRRKTLYTTVFVGGKQKRVRRRVCFYLTVIYVFKLIFVTRILNSGY